MAWTYSDYITFTGQDRLTRLRLHIQEVSDALTARTTTDGETYDPATLTSYLDGLQRKEQQISAALTDRPFFAPTRRRD